SGSDIYSNGEIYSYDRSSKSYERIQHDSSPFEVRTLDDKVIIFNNAGIDRLLIKYKGSSGLYSVPSSTSEKSVDVSIFLNGVRDSDDDGVSDYDEIILYGTDPLAAQSNQPSGAVVPLSWN